VLVDEIEYAHAGRQGGRNGSTQQTLRHQVGTRRLHAERPTRTPRGRIRGAPAALIEARRDSVFAPTSSRAGLAMKGQRASILTCAADTSCSSRPARRGPLVAAGSEVAEPAPIVRLARD